MIPELEMALSFDGDEWIAGHEGCVFRAHDLKTLEDQIAGAIQQLPRYAGCSTVHVWLAFDFDTMPAWLRQYHSHYFNSRITVKLPHANTFTDSNG